MKKFKSNKKSILSLFLAFLLSISFNSSTIISLNSLLKTTTAYESSDPVVYYVDSVNTGTQTGVTKNSDYPELLDNYFSESTTEFNIGTYYTKEFTSLYSTYVHQFLSNVVEDADGNTSYSENYLSFLEKNDVETLYEYYDNNKTKFSTNLGIGDFKSYVEYFVTHESTADTVEVTKLLNKNSSNQNKSEFYCMLANYLNIDGQQSATDPEINSDTTADEFYKNSVHYKRIKDYIDAIIINTVAIYSYDGKTQDNKVLAMFADNAPSTIAYSYDTTYESIVNKPAYEKIDDHFAIYYFGNKSDIITEPGYIQCSNYFKEEAFGNASLRNSNLMGYELITSGEGFIDHSHPTYHLLTSSTPYLTNSTGTLYTIFVKDENVTADEYATYKSLNYTVITQDDLDDDANGYYYNLPFDETTFKTISGYTDESSYSFEKYCDIFAPKISEDSNVRNSIIYLKRNLTQDYVIYIDSSSELTGTVTPDEANTSIENKFKLQYPSYPYTVKGVIINDSNKYDYKELTSSFGNGTNGNYYKSGYNLYVQKTKIYYENSTTNFSSTYETKTAPNVAFEQANVPSTKYVGNKQIFVEQKEDDEIVTISEIKYLTINGQNYQIVTTDELNDESNRNFYIKVPSSESDYLNDFLEVEHSFYYKHQTITQNKLYILVSDDEENDAKENNVYKNLNYNVLTKSELRADPTSYIEVPSTDSNYDKNFSLYYKYSIDSDSLYVKNILKEGNAIYVLDNSTTISNSNLTAYAKNFYTPIKNSDLESEKDFYVKISSDDLENYSTVYTSLYYKYNVGEASKVIYSASDIDTSASDFNSGAYILIGSTDENYVTGEENYYKKIGTTTTTKAAKNSTYGYYTSATTLDAASYYVVSFYVNTTGAKTQTSVYIVDEKSIIDDIKFEHISTNGTWQKYYAFIATDNISSSSLSIHMYFGDKNNIVGNTGETSVTGSVLFDEIKFTKIGVTDFNKKAIDDKEVLVPLTDEDGNVIENTYIDDAEYKNRAFMTSVNKRVYADADIKVWNDAAGEYSYSWNDMFTFENNDLLAEKLNSSSETGLAAVTTNTTGYTHHSNVWEYFVDPTLSESGNYNKLKQRQQAYIAGELSVEVTDEIEESKSTDDEDTNNSTSTTKKDVMHIDSPFVANNKVLKLTNSNTNNIPLGVVSSSFTIKQMNYYKITVWVYSPDKDGEITVGIGTFLKTYASSQNGDYLSASTTVKGNMKGYTNTPTNEYSFIPVEIYVEGNALQNQDCFIFLCAEESCTAYFDNITIEYTTSAKFDTANSDSSNLTCALSLTPSNYTISTGVTNGNFDFVAVTSIDQSNNADPKEPESWTNNENNSKAVVAGIVSTNKTYADLPNSFFNSHIVTTPYLNGFNYDNSYSNIYAIYAPTTYTSTINSQTVNAKSTHLIYSATTSLSASTTYELSFKFYKNTGFSGNLVANLYKSSYSSENIISTIKLSSAEIGAGWQTYKFVVANGATTTSVILEIGVTEATGIAYFAEVKNTSSSSTYEELKLAAAESNGIDNIATKDIYQAIKDIKFINLSENNLSVHSDNFDEDTNLYTQYEYNTTLVNNSKYTTGTNGVLVAGYYVETPETTYSVEIDKTTYYVGETYEVVIEDISYYVVRHFNSTTNKYYFALYKDENLTEKLEKLNDKNIAITYNSSEKTVSVKLGDDTISYNSIKTTYKLFKYKDLTNVINKIGDLDVSIENLNTVVVGLVEDETNTDYSINSAVVNSYEYNFVDKDYTINNVFISAEDLQNAQSENVLVLASSYNTDYIKITPNYTKSLTTSAYYVLRIYAKTSDFEEGFGLNIEISDVSTEWKNINTTTNENADEYGFVCYEVLITSNTTSITNLGVTFSLGSEENTGSGYAIISAVTLEKYDSQDEFEHYASSINDDSTTAKKFYGKVSETSTDTSTEEEKVEETDDTNNISWATFFYIFSSVLLVLTIIVAIVAMILKKHPIKRAVKAENEHEKDIETLKVPEKSKTVDITKKTKKSDTKSIE